MMLDIDMVCMVVTMGSRRILSATTKEAIKHKRIRSIVLQSIDKWYHAGLACQILDVCGIPAELEKYIPKILLINNYHSVQKRPDFLYCTQTIASIEFPKKPIDNMLYLH